MLLHIVLIKPRPDADAGAIDRLSRIVSSLQRKIPGIIGYHWGPNSSPERLGRGYELGFLMTFENAEARDAYLPHPEHLRIAPFMEPVAQEVLDYDIAA